MPAKATTGSPTLSLTISAEQYERAKQSDSGACLIADAIKSQYPNMSSVSVDMATIRCSDRKRGVRFTYLTPPEAQHLLLSFDQGWSNPTESVTIRRAVKINAITRTKGKDGTAATKLRREERRAQLEARVADGDELTTSEKRALTQLRKPYVPVERPASQPAPVVTGQSIPTVVGGQPIPQGPAHPNLLRSRNRHFGARVAAPGVQWEQAVEQAVAERLAQRAQNNAD
jgi:hypothetical protein